VRQSRRRRHSLFTPHRRRRFHLPRLAAMKLEEG
jgi:hypothetical protein